MTGVLDRVPCGIVAFADDGTILEVNQTLLDLTGRGREEVEKSPFTSLFSAGGRLFFQTHFNPSLRLHGHIEEVHFTLRSTRAGGDVPVLINAVRRQRDGRTINDCVIVPTLQRNQYEDELLLARKAAEAARDAKSRFLSMMSHDLRTPLQAIQTYTELIVSPRRGSLTDTQHSDVLAIRNASREMLRMMDDILAFAQLESESVQVVLAPVPVDQALTRAEALVVARFAEAGLGYVREDGERRPVVLADADRLQQVLLNFLTNAIKFTPRGGTIRTGVRIDGNRVGIEVADTGRGIAAADLERIFDPFVQIDAGRTDASRRGIGLGLSICRDLALAMGGEVSARSEVGTGSCFTIHLPPAVL